MSLCVTLARAIRVIVKLAFEPQNDQCKRFLTKLFVFGVDIFFEHAAVVAAAIVAVAQSVVFFLEVLLMV